MFLPRETLPTPIAPTPPDTSCHFAKCKKVPLNPNKVSYASYYLSYMLLESSSNHTCLAKSVPDPPLVPSGNGEALKEVAKDSRRCTCGVCRVIPELGLGQGIFDASFHCYFIPLAQGHVSFSHHPLALSSPLLALSTVIPSLLHLLLESFHILFSLLQWLFLVYGISSAIRALVRTPPPIA